jgi:methylmalonyl-CoA mutase
MSISPLADGFEPATLEAWQDKALQALKGADLSALSSRTADGLAVDPLYSPADGAAVEARPADTAWDIVALADHPDGRAANGQVLADLEGGASGVSIAFAHAPSAGRFGLPAEADTLSLLLQDVYLDLVHLRIEPHRLAKQSAHWMADLFERRGIEPSRGIVSFGLDPLGNFAWRGVLTADRKGIAKRIASTVDMLKGKGFSGRFVEADGRNYHAAGATDAQELAAVLATAVDYLRFLTETGSLSVDEAFDAIGASLAVDQHQLASIAKMRAMRLLWQRLQDLCGAGGKALRLHAETSRRMMMADDPHTNILRTTLAAFAAGTGGADSITILPFSCALGLADRQARRVARNLHHLLLDESNLHRVADPAAGSGAIEALTEGLCEAAWTEFQMIEAEGGILDSLISGGLQGRIAGARQSLEHLLASGSEVLVGATIYPHASPAKVPVVDAAPWPDPEFKDVVLDCTPLTPASLVEG